MAAAGEIRTRMNDGDQLLYGQNWEDSALEIDALDIRRSDRVIAVAGAGCTTLALLARGPRSLHAVDRNLAQLQLLRLKLAAVCHLPPGEAAGFLGGVRADHRLRVFNALSPKLDRDTAAFWDQRGDAIARGVISQGRVERFFGFIRRLLRLVHSRRRIEQAFEQATLEAQRLFYDERWDTAGWRALFLLAHKRILDRVLDPAFYQYVDGRGLSRDLRERAARCMTRLPMRSNYFLSWILRGHYGDDDIGRPDYLSAGSVAALRQHAETLQTHRADLGAFLRAMPDSSGDKFYLSNVCEWLPDAELGPFFKEIGRVARDGATVCYRALMVDRPRPASVESLFSEDPEHSVGMAKRDRAFINVGFHRLTVCKGGHADARA
jgi:S-adenosylmethionine-diacylglycerol 3-amino-3-carboxypropyl transferase